MNSAYIGKLMELAEKDRNVMHLLADSGTGYDEMFRRNFPGQMFNFGIAEENMVSAAAGMASAGKIPFVFTAGSFLAYRSMEFIRDDICFQDLNVKIVGMGSGLSWSSLGPTHHTTEDVSVLRAIPNLMLLSASTPNQVRACVQKAYEFKGPVYIKIEMNKEKEYFPENCVINDSGMDVVREGKDLLIFTTGSILEEVMDASEMLAEEGCQAQVVNVACLKPFDHKKTAELAAGFDNIYTIEEHNIFGGLGGIIAETVAYGGLCKKVVPIGLCDRFAEGYGTLKAVRRANQLDAASLCKKIKETL